MIKHRLFCNGSYYTVWGPASITKCWIEFLKMAAKATGERYDLLIYALQLSNIPEHPLNDIRAYKAWEILQTWYNPHIPLIIKCDEFLTSTPPPKRVSAPLLPSAQAVQPSKGSSDLDQLTEIVISRRASRSAMITSPFISVRVNQSLWTRLYLVASNLRKKIAVWYWPFLQITLSV